MKSTKLIHRFLFLCILAVATSAAALPLPPGAGSPSGPLDPAAGIRAKAEIETYLQGILRDYKLPNIAVQLVGRDGPLWQITLGYRDLQSKLPVTNQTLYAIGSTSKAFTGFLMMQLQEQGRLHIDDAVQIYRPDFAVSKPQYSSMLTLRDLMTHATGVGRHDLAWYHRSASREELFALIPHLEMEAEPRTQFIYNNWMWLAVGLVAERLTGETWEKLVRERIFAPLGMTSSVLSVAEVRQSRDYALPYEVSPLGVNEVPFYDIAAMNPAGGIYSNLQDLSQWLRLHLNGGQLDSKTLISKAALEESYRGIQSMGGKAKYALGWATLPMSGYRFLTHDGGIDGFTANISMLPDQGLGVVVLMNASSIAGVATCFEFTPDRYGPRKHTSHGKVHTGTDAALSG